MLVTGASYILYKSTKARSTRKYEHHQTIPGVFTLHGDPEWKYESLRGFNRDNGGDNLLGVHDMYARDIAWTGTMLEGITRLRLQGNRSFSCADNMGIVWIHARRRIVDRSMVQDIGCSSSIETIEYFVSNRAQGFYNAVLLLASTRLRRRLLSDCCWSLDA